MGNSALGRGTAVEENKVKASSGDGTPDFLDGKVDGTTMSVVGDQLVRAALTGGVTTVGNAATVVTNANLTGVVTSTGNATAIADKALAISKLADGTDGELITWDASGVISTVPAGTATQVLTSNGAGAAPTFQAAAGGGDLTLVSVTSGSGTNTGDITISASNRYLVVWSCNSGSASNVEFRVNSLTAANYAWGASKKALDQATSETYFGTDNQGEIPVIDQADTLDGTNGILRGHFYMDTLLNSGTLPHSIYIWGESMYRTNANDFYSWKFSGAYQASITVASFEIDFGGTGTAHAVYLYQLANS
jgi:hypothetical protein